MARVSYVSPDPEFTPPVIYSLDTRQKLVYLVEARPEGATSMLQPGQIVDVDLADGAVGNRQSAVGRPALASWSSNRTTSHPYCLLPTAYCPFCSEPSP